MATSNWTFRMRESFEHAGYAALYIEGPEHPIPRRFGDNMGGWPVRLGVSQSWKDTVTPEANRRSPYHWQGLLFRVWTPGLELARRLLKLTEAYIADRGENIKLAWLDLGPELDIALLEFEIHDVAKRHAITTWDDAGLVAMLKETETRRMRRDFERQGA